MLGDVLTELAASGRLPGKPTPAELRAFYTAILSAARESDRVITETLDDLRALAAPARLADDAEELWDAYENRVEVGLRRIEEATVSGGAAVALDADDTKPFTPENTRAAELARRSGGNPTPRGSRVRASARLDPRAFERETSMSRAPVATAATKGMAWIPGGTFAMGSESHYPEEAPVRDVAVDGFWMDVHPVTNLEFTRFVKATGYVTYAEQAPDRAQYPDAKDELLFAGSVVFRKTDGPVDLGDHFNWWAWVRGADWRHPEGPESTLHGRERHPVVHVAHRDAAAYATWAGKELPTEAEWEHAARGGLDGAEFAWGDEFTPRGRPLANTWQGRFPYENTLDDGYEGTSPVGKFPPNGFGLRDMIGNVWEWTSDWYAAGHEPSSACCGGDPRLASIDPNDPAAIPRRVTKGGSHLCAPSYCRRYRPAARMAQPIDTSTSHLGFRCLVRR